MKYFVSYTLDLIDGTSYKSKSYSKIIELSNLTEEEISYCRDEKKRILSKESYTKKDDFTYFNLPDEKIATEWGLDYMYNHAEEVALLWHKLQPLIQLFYKLNGIKED